jgi:hypothetical protein
MRNGLNIHVKANVVTTIGLPSLTLSDYLGLTIRATHVDNDDARPDWWSIVIVHKDGSRLELAHEFDYLSAVGLLCHLCTILDIKVVNHDE